MNNPALFQGKVKITYNQEIVKGANVMWVNAPEIAAAAKPGQFVMMTCDYGQGRILRRPISIYQVLENTVGFGYSAVGEGTRWLGRRKAEDTLDVLGPMGNGFSINPNARNLLLIAGGIGIAPLNYVAYEALKKGQNVKLLAGVKTASLQCPPHFLPQGCEYIVATEDGTSGEKGFVTTLIPQHAAWADQVFICGPLPMYKTIANRYQTYLQNKPVQISLEVRMGCGLGFCYSCTIKTAKGVKQVCKDGPVFDMQDIIWDELN